VRTLPLLKVLLPVLLLVLLLIGDLVEAAQMSVEQRRGQQIYLTGKSPSGQPIQARLNNSGALLPATLMPCVNCHKYDGKGIPEGGITPADIRWVNLTKPYGIGQSSNRAGEKSRPPYNRRSIKKAIAMGLNSGGEALNQVMPRYQLNLQDMQDLIAYLTGLGSYQASGISGSQINIGVILPHHNRQKSQAIRQILSAWFADLNQQGGIYQRQLLPVFIEPPANHSESTLAQFRVKLEQSNIFAFVASHLDGIEALMADFTQSSGIPVIGAFTPTPLLDFPLNRNIFYLLSGQKNQTQALQSFTQQLAPKDKSAVLVDNKAAVKPLLMHLTGQQQKPQIIKLDPDNSAAQLKARLSALQQKHIEVIYLLVSQPNQAVFFKLAASINWWPNVLIPASQMSGALFNSHQQFDQRIFVAMPNLPLDYKKAGLADYQRLQQEYQVTLKFRNSQLLAIASARLLKEGLIKTGREMQQPKLVAMVEGLYQFNTGLTRPISYGPNRRLGTSGAYIVTVDLLNKTIRPVSDWLEIK
jgi:ABC-type branched-subunit amino acid transport system substrate-binding protein